MSLKAPWSLRSRFERLGDVTARLSNLDRGSSIQRVGADEDGSSGSWRASFLTLLVEFDVLPFARRRRSELDFRYFRAGGRLLSFCDWLVPSLFIGVGSSVVAVAASAGTHGGRSGDRCIGNSFFSAGTRQRS